MSYGKCMLLLLDLCRIVLFFCSLEDDNRFWQTWQRKLQSVLAGRRWKQGVFYCWRSAVLLSKIFHTWPCICHVLNCLALNLYGSNHMIRTLGCGLWVFWWNIQMFNCSDVICLYMCTCALFGKCCTRTKPVSVFL